MTCAAVGAVYYGWNALSDRERNELLERLAAGFAIGVELIKAVLRFVIDKTKELLSSKNIEEIKRFVSEGAALFGRTLGDVTHRIVDVVGDGLDAVRSKTGAAMSKTVDLATDTYVAVSDSAAGAMENVRRKVTGDPPVLEARVSSVPTIDEAHIASEPKRVSSHQIRIDASMRPKKAQAPKST